MKRTKPNYNAGKIIELKTKGDVNGPITTYFLPREEIDRIWPKSPNPVPPYGGGAA